MADLFLYQQSKKDQLRDWILSRAWTKSSDVVRWGLENYHIRSERDCRDFAKEGLIKRMDDQEKMLTFGPISEDVWVPV